MLQITKCPICSSPTISPDFACKDFFLTQEDFNIFICNKCGFRFTNPVPEENSADSYYNSDEYFSHSPLAKKGVFSKLYFLVRQHTLKNKYKIVKKYSSPSFVGYRGSVRCLDIGCGTGEFLAELKKKDYDVVGIEPNAKAREFAQSNYQLNIYDNAEINKFPDKSFDIITLWHALEHIYNIKNLVAEISRILRDDGTLFIALPNHKSYDARYYKHFWAAYDVPRHLYHFSQKTITNLLSIYNFKSVKKVPMWMDSFYVSLLSEKYKKGKIDYLSGFIIGLLSDVFACFTGDFSSLIYIFKKRWNDGVME